VWCRTFAGIDQCQRSGSSFCQAPGRRTCP
jgi:hypothetical protein